MRRYMLGLAMVAVVAVGAGVGLVNTGVIAKEKPAPEVIAPAQAGTVPDDDSTPKPTQVVQAQLAQGQAAQAQVAQAAEKNDPLSERVLGDPNAPITILEYSSLTCPHCASFHANTLPQLKKDYIDTGKAKLVFRDFPFDRAALQASMLARCSNPERYFGFLDVLFKSQNKWAGASDPAQALAQTGKLAGVGEQQFQACMGNEALANKLIERRLEAEQKYQVQSTPTFVILRGDATEKIVGAQPIAEFARVLDKLGS
ncbi:DsbA family protein [Skermanella sp. TT6]|nr:DsbA family protein [Skermanella sp. TT6]